MLKGERTDVLPTVERNLITAELSRGDDGREPALQTQATSYSYNGKDGTSQGTALIWHTHDKNTEMCASAEMTS